MKKKLLIVVVALMNITAQGQKKVAMIESISKTKGISIFVKSMVRGELTKFISSASGFEAFSRSDIDKVIKEMKFQRSGMVNDAQRKRLGQMSGADYICVSKISKEGKSYYIQAHLIDIESGKIENPATAFAVGGMEDVNQACEKLANELVKNQGSFGTRRTNRNSHTSGQNYTEEVEGISIEMVYVQGGTFDMGSNNGDDDEKPVHQVTLGDYYIGKYEVTQAQWKAVMGHSNNPSHFKGDNLPVENVSWNDAKMFISRLNRKTGKRYSLPTEAEWEYAARGGNKSEGMEYSGGGIDYVGWYEGNSNSKTHPVGEKWENELGIYDMSGNVWEWCSDWYGSYSSSSQTDPKGPSSGSNRVNRGGCWYGSASYCRVANRDSDSPGYRLINLGFRLSLK